MPLLDYATPRTDRRPWGPILIRPSRRSVLFLAIAIAAFVWLHFRHEAWRQTGTVAGQGYAYFTPDDQLLSYDPATGLQLHDRVTGQRLRTIVPPGDPKANPERWIVMPQREHVLVIPEAGQPIRIFEFASGRLIDVIPNPRIPTEFVLGIDPTSARFVTGDDNNFRNPPGQWARPPKLWQLARSNPSPATAPANDRDFRATDLPMLGYANFSPDGKRLLQSNSSRPADGYALIDSDTGQVILRQPMPQSIGLSTGFLDARTFWVIDSRAAMADTSPPGNIEFRDTHDGHVTRTLNTAIPIAPSTSTSLSADGQVVQVNDYRGREFDLYDAATGRFLNSHNAPLFSGGGLLPDSRRFIGRDPFTGYPALYSLRSDCPIALLRLGSRAPLNPACLAARDGQTILFINRDVSPGWATHIFHPTGPDCPESPLGLLAFPHTWLLIASIIALAFSLRRDASPAQAVPLAKALTLAIVLTTLPRTLQFILEGATGQLVLTATPLLFLCGIALATASRFWQALTILPLLAELVILVHCLGRLRTDAVLGASTFTLPLLDRTYEAPTLALFIPLAALLASIPFAILILARRAAARTISTHT